MNAKRIVAGMVMLTLAGCGSGGITTTQKAAANKQWNDARASVLASLAADQFKNGNFDKCQDTLNEALPLAPASAELRLLAAKLAIEQDKLEIAEAQLAEARKLNPKDAEVDYLSGVVQQRWQQPAKACEYYGAAVIKNPVELSYVLAKAEMLVAMNEPDEALALLRSNLSAFDHSAVLHDEIGELQVQQHRYRDAIIELRKASILSLDDTTIREHLAFALFKDGEYADAISLLDRLMEDPAYVDRADVMAAAGECRQSIGDLSGARRNLEAATNTKPCCAGYWLELARVTTELNDLPAAEIAVRRAISLDARSAEGQCLLGYVLLKQNRLIDSLNAFASASSLDANDAVSMSLQGYVLEKLGRRQDAQSCYAKALKLNPHDELTNRLLVTDGRD
jgi:tetratricopeptide (TPR) repeat protein